MSNSTTSNFNGYIFILLGSILFSTKAVMVKMAFRETQVDAVSLLALRMLFALPFFFVTGIIALKRHRAALPEKKHWLYIIAMGLLGYYVSSLLDFMGLQYITAGMERLILFLYPSFTVLMNAFLFKEKITSIQKWALGLCYLGLFISFYHEVNMDIHMNHLFLGSILVFLCSITYAGYIVGTGRLLKHVPVMVYTPFALIASTVGVFVHYAFAGKHSISEIDGRMVVFGLLLGLIATVVPNFLVSSGIKRVGASNAAIVSAIGPVSTIILAYFFLDEKMDFFQLTGTLLVIMGILLVSSKMNLKSIFSGVLKPE